MQVLAYSAVALGKVGILCLSFLICELALMSAVLRGMRLLTPREHACNGPPVPGTSDVATHVLSLQVRGARPPLGQVEGVSPPNGPGQGPAPP